MLVEINKVDPEVFDSIYGRIVRKYNNLKETKDKKIRKLKTFKKKKPKRD
tara:strand:- start:6636 stop:6785 length:150 start_codon:yes stop_codon:yes gene_type:complete